MKHGDAFGQGLVDALALVPSFEQMHAVLNKQGADVAKMLDLVNMTRTQLAAVAVRSV